MVNDDLADVIAQLRTEIEWDRRDGYTTIAVDLGEAEKLLDAAEAAATARAIADDARAHYALGIQTARDAALEEAANIIDDSRGEVEDDDNGRSAAVDEHCRFLLSLIRALRRPT